MDIEKLSDFTLKNAAPRPKPCRLADSRGLYIEVTPNGSKMLAIEIPFRGEGETLSARVYPELTLKAARKAAMAARGFDD